MYFKNGLIISFGAHVVIILIMAIRSVFMPTAQIVDLSQAVRVDMVSLPDQNSDKELPEKIQEILREKTTPEHEPTVEPEEPKTEKKTESIKTKDLAPQKIIKPDLAAVDLTKSKKKQKIALDKLKKMSAIEKIKQDLKNDPDTKDIKKSQPIKGRILSAGTKIVGLDKLQSDEYLSQLDAQIKSHWNLPQWMIGKPFKTTIWVKLNANGTVISKKISSSSGNPTYDNYCLMAVEKASPFPIVPEKFSEVYKTDGVSFAFPE